MKLTDTEKNFLLCLLNDELYHCEKDIRKYFSNLSISKGFKFTRRNLKSIIKKVEGK
jgi:hypothetical protein